MRALSHCLRVVASGTLLSFGSLAQASALAGQGAEHGLFAEINLAGPFIRAFGNSLTDATVDHLEVGRWAWPGLTVGSRLHKRLAVAATVQPGPHLVLYEAWGFAGARDGQVQIDHRPGALWTVQARVHPLGNGWYVGVGLLHARATDYRMEFVRDGPTARLGEGDYASDLVAAWRREAYTSPSLGVGYQHRLASGLSLALGIDAPLHEPEGTQPTLTFLDSTVEPSAADAASARRAILDETFYAPVLFRIGIGWSR